MRVIDLMAVEVVSVRPDTSLKEAARVMVDLGISGLPVTAEDGSLRGIVTEGDYLRKELERGQLGAAPMLDALFRKPGPEADAETVGEIMTTEVHTVGTDATLVEAARDMAEHGVKRLPVVDGDGKLVGVISRHDIVSAFTRPDEVIEDEIREDLIARLLFLDPASLDVTVNNGVVRVAGELPAKSDARMLEAMVQRTDGVIRAEFDLTWRVDDTTQSAPEAPLP